MTLCPLLTSATRIKIKTGSVMNNPITIMIMMTSRALFSVKESWPLARMVTRAKMSSKTMLSLS